MKNKGYVFVYGTLKVGGRFSFNYVNQRLRSQPATIKGTMYKLGWYPGITIGGDKTIHGELHLFKDFVGVVKSMDRVEGFRGRKYENNLFNKHVVEAETDTGEKVKAMVYAVNHNVTDLNKRDVVEDGVWKIEKK